jgi:hypothetical protein
LFIFSTSQLFPIDTDIRKIPNDSNTQDFEGSTLYIHDINTKYYNTKIALLPVEDISSSSLSEGAKNKLEGILVHFNSHDAS